jgi:hypothetical protein
MSRSKADHGTLVTVEDHVRCSVCWMISEMGLTEPSQNKNMSVPACVLE